MSQKKVIKVERLEIVVAIDVYNAANREKERVKKKRQRLRADGIECEMESLTSLFLESGYEPAAEDDVAETAVKNVMSGQIWEIVDAALDKTDAFIITAYYRDKLTETKIANMLGIKQQNVGKRRKKAERKLKAALKLFKNYFSE